MNNYEIKIDLAEINLETDGSPHNPIAQEMLSYLLFNYRDELMEDVIELKTHTMTFKVVNGVEIGFEIKDKFLEITYEIPGGEQFSSNRLFKALTTNNPPDQELLISIAQAEVNAQLFKAGAEFRLQNFAALVFYVPIEEARTLRFRFRNWAKQVLWRFGR